MIINTNHEAQNINALVRLRNNSIKFPNPLRQRRRKNKVKNPRKYRKNPKNSPGNSSSVPTHILDTNGGVDHNTTIIKDLITKLTDINFPVVCDNIYHLIPIQICD